MFCKKLVIRVYALKVLSYRFMFTCFDSFDVCGRNAKPKADILVANIFSLLLSSPITRKCCQGSCEIKFLSVGRESFHSKPKLCLFPIALQSFHCIGQGHVVPSPSFHDLEYFGHSRSSENICLKYPFGVFSRFLFLNVADELLVSGES